MRPAPPRPALRRTLVNDKMAVAEAGEDLKKLATVLLEDAEPKAEVRAPLFRPPPPRAACLSVWAGAGAMLCSS